MEENTVLKLMGQEQSFFRKWGTLMVLSLALAIIIIDTTLLNVSLSTLLRELHTTIPSLQWVITAYSLMLAAFTVTGGRLGDLFGRKKMFMTGAIIFAVGSFIASISKNVGVLLAGESIIEGIGAALMMPATASLLVSKFKGHDRAIAFGVWGGIAGVSSAIGPLLGGYLTSHYSWRWGFRINVVVVLILLLGSVLIRESKEERKKPSLDWIGVFLSALGLLGIVFGIIESSTYGWLKSKANFFIGHYLLHFGSYSIVLPSILLGLLLLVAFAFWESHVEKMGKQPLVSMKLFKNRQFTSGAVTTGAMTLGMTGIIFVFPVFLQAVLGLDAFHTGLAMLPLSISVLVFSPPVALLSKKITPKYLIQTGLVVDVIALWVLRQSLHADMHASGLILGFSLFGLGMAFVMGPVSNLTLSAVPVSEAGEASGVNNTIRQIGSSLGAAIIGAVLLSSLASNLQQDVNKSQIIPEPAKPVITQSIANANSTVEFGGSANVPAGIPVPVVNEIAHIAKTATTEANRDALVYAMVFAVLGVLVSFGLPALKNVDVHNEGTETPADSTESGSTQEEQLSTGNNVLADSVEEDRAEKLQPEESAAAAVPGAQNSTDSAEKKAEPFDYKEEKMGTVPHESYAIIWILFLVILVGAAFYAYYESRHQNENNSVAGIPNYLLNYKGISYQQNNANNSIPIAAQNKPSGIVIQPNPGQVQSITQAPRSSVKTSPYTGAQLNQNNSAQLSFVQNSSQGSAQANSTNGALGVPAAGSANVAANVPAHNTSASTGTAVVKSGSAGHSGPVNTGSSARVAHPSTSVTTAAGQMVNPSVHNVTLADTQSGTVYTFNDLALQITTPLDWKGVEDYNQGAEISFYDQSQLVMHGYIRVKTVTQTTLDNIQKQLMADPMVEKIAPTVVAGVQALAYYAPNYGGISVVFIYKGNAYYLNGAVLEPQILNTIRLN